MKNLKNIALAIAITSFGYSNIQCMDTVTLTETDKNNKIDLMYTKYGLTNPKAQRFDYFLTALKEVQDKYNLKIDKNLYDNLLKASNLFSKYSSLQAVKNTITIAGQDAIKMNNEILTLKIINYAISTTAYGRRGPIPTAAP